jgi:hypothetical protein
VVCPAAGELSESELASCVQLAGESPVAVSTGAPRSRLRSRAERLGAKRSVESLQRSRMAPWGGSKVVGPMPKGVNPAAS